MNGLMLRDVASCVVLQVEPFNPAFNPAAHTTATADTRHHVLKLAPWRIFSGNHHLHFVFTLPLRKRQVLWHLGVFALLVAGKYVRGLVYFVVCLRSMGFLLPVAPYYLYLLGSQKRG